MTSVLSNLNWSVGGGGGGVQDSLLVRSRIYKVPSSALYVTSGGSLLAQCPFLPCGGKARHSITPVYSSILDPADSEDDENRNEESSRNEPEGGNNELFRDDLERMVGTDDSSFSGIDLATLIRKKYGRSYDVQLIKKEFMGKNLLALNVMWKYREQEIVYVGSVEWCLSPLRVTQPPNWPMAYVLRSFPLTEEEYLLRLDDVANTLKCWGAVSHIRNSLAKLKDRPRIGKAVSIFIDMDESGGRSNEWIYK